MRAAPAAAILLTLLFALVPYLRTRGFEPTYDDHHHLVRNDFLARPANAALLFGPAYLEHELSDQGRPLTLLTFFADRALFGDDAGLWHLHSALWHALASVLLLFAARRLGLSWAAAAVAAALFALHPAHAEAVANVSNREDPIAGALVLASILAGAAALSRHPAWAAAAGIAWGLGLLAKESALCAPLLFAIFVAREPALRAAPRPRWIALGAAAALGAIPAVLLQLRLGFPSLASGAGGAPLGRTLAIFLRAGEGPSPLVAGPAELLRAVQVVLGWPLSAEHDQAMIEGPLAWAIGLAGVTALAALSIALRRRAPWVSLGLLWFFAATLPVWPAHMLLNPIADRYLYLPVAAVAIALAGSLVERPRGKSVLVLAVAAYASLAAGRIGVWHDDVVLFADATAHAPRSARAWQNLGAAHQARGHDADAERALSRAASLDPELLAPRINLAALAERRGRIDRAIAHLDAAVAIPPVRGEVALHDRALAMLLAHLYRRRDEARMRAAIEREIAVHAGCPVAAAWSRRLP